MYGDIFFSDKVSYTEKVSLYMRIFCLPKNIVNTVLFFNNFPLLHSR